MATEKKKTESKRNVLIRTYSAGVHYGVLESREGKEVVLTDAKRVWHWKGANTLHELALRGPGKGSRISEAVPRIELIEAIEVIDCGPAAVDVFASARWDA